jgi:hypothetical protein
VHGLRHVGGVHVVVIRILVLDVTLLNFVNALVERILRNFELVHQAVSIEQFVRNVLERLTVGHFVQFETIESPLIDVL